MAKYKWRKHRKIKFEDTWTTTSSDQYTVTYSGEGTFTGATSSATISIPPIRMGDWDYQPVDVVSRCSTTTLENTITIPFASVEAVGTVEQFVERIIPDGYAIVEYNMNMDEGSLDMVTVYYKAELVPSIMVNESAYLSVDSDTVRLSPSTALTPQILEDGSNGATINFGRVDNEDILRSIQDGQHPRHYSIGYEVA